LASQHMNILTAGGGGNSPCHHVDNVILAGVSSG